MTRRRRVPKPGTVLAVPLGDGRRGIARVLVSPLVAFYDLVLPDGEFDLANLTQTPDAFRICVMKDALRDESWNVLGVLPLSEEEELHHERFFRQDVITGKLTIYWEVGVAGHEIPASLKEAEDLEPVAAYESWHVVDRLRDHFDGVPNGMVERQRPVGPAEFLRQQQERRLGNAKNSI